MKNKEGSKSSYNISEFSLTFNEGLKHYDLLHPFL